MDSFDNYGTLDQLYFKATREIEEDKIADAFETLSRIIEQDTEFGKAYNLLGWVYYNKYNNYNKAEECFKLAMKYVSENPSVYQNYASLLLTLEKFETLKEHLDHAINIPGINKPEIWNKYGTMYELQGQYDQAIQAYKEAIKYSLINEDIEAYEKSILRSKKKIAIN